MSNLIKHTENARAALAQANRFMKATGHAGVDGSAWATGINLDARIMHASTARMFAELACHEAAHAKGDADGPTDLQTEASKVADCATHLMQQMAYDICRGALKVNTDFAVPGK